jgi:hypothetical protein
MLLHRKLKHRLHKHHKHLERGNLRQLIVLEAAAPAPAPAPSFSTTYPSRNFWLHTVLPSIKYDGTFEHGSSPPLNLAWPNLQEDLQMTFTVSCFFQCAYAYQE